MRILELARSFEVGLVGQVGHCSTTRKGGGRGRCSSLKLLNGGSQSSIAQPKPSAGLPGRPR